MDSFESEESKSEAAATLASPSAVVIAALASGVSLPRARRRLLSHIADASQAPLGCATAFPGTSNDARSPSVLKRISAAINPTGMPDEGSEGSSRRGLP